MVEFPVISVNGYWDPNKQMCIPFAKPEGDKPAYPDEDPIPAKKTVAAEPTPKPAVSWFNTSGGMFGCGIVEEVESPNPLCKDSTPSIASFELLCADEIDINSPEHDGTCLANTTLTAVIKAQTCAEDVEDLLVEVSVDKEAFAEAEYDTAGGVFKHTFTAPKDKAGPHYINIKAQDTGREGAGVVKKQGEFWVDLGVEKKCLPPEEFEIGHTWPPKGFIPHQEIEFNVVPKGNYCGDFDLSGLEYAWVITHEDGTSICEGTGSAIVCEPPKKGTYNVYLTVTLKKTKLDEKAINFIINALPAPTAISVNGPQHPKAGMPGVYSVNIPEEQPEHAAELSDCTWKVTYFDPISGDKVPVLQDDPPTCAQPLIVNFPADFTTDVAYEIRVTAESQDGLWEPSVTSAPYPVTLHPAQDVEDIQLDFGITYPEDGAIPFRDFSFQATLPNAPGYDLEYTYEWEVRQFGILIAKPDSSTPFATHQFNNKDGGAYTVVCRVYEDPEKTVLMDEMEKPVIIGSFPKPQIALNINNNDPVYKEGVLLSAQIIRDGELWDEDKAAAFAWTVSKMKDDLSGYEVVECLDGEAAGNTYSCAALEAGKDYKVGVTVTGYNGEIDVYTVPKTGVFTVNNPWIGVPSAVITDNLEFSYHVGDTVENISCVSDQEEEANLTFGWIVTRPCPTPESDPEEYLETFEGEELEDGYKTLKPYTFECTGTYSFKCQVTAEDGVTKNYDIKQVHVYEPEVIIPTVAISGPYSTHLGEEATLYANSNDPNATFIWTVTPPAGETYSTEPTLDKAFTPVLDQVGDWGIKLTVTAPDGKTKNEQVHPISVYPESVSIPSAVITGLKYSYVVGKDNIIEQASCITDAADASIQWIVTGPNGVETLDTIEGYVLEEGHYNFKCEVTAKDGVTKNYDIFPVNVNPAEINLPQAGIIAPPSAKTGEDVPFFAADPDLTVQEDEKSYNFLWDFGDGKSSTEKDPTHKYNIPDGKMATYTVKLTVRRQDNENVYDIATQKITITPQTVDAPAFFLDIPYAEEQDKEVPMAIDLEHPEDWTIDWEYGDGDYNLDFGPATSHTYTQAGKYQIICKLTSTLDPNYKISVPFGITIIEHGKPVPNVTVSPSWGKPPLNVIVDASKSYATAFGTEGKITKVEVDWGNQTAKSVEDNPVLFSNITIPQGYSCSVKTNCAYTIHITVYDMYGNFSSITIPVTVQG